MKLHFKEFDFATTRRENIIENFILDRIYI